MSFPTRSRCMVLKIKLRVYSRGRYQVKTPFMFGKTKQQESELQKQVETLKRQLEETQQKYEHGLKTLRLQVAGILSGFPPTAASVLAGLPYSEIPKEQVPEFIQNIPDLLILDVRSDEGWSNGYIPNAKHVPANQIFLRLGELADKNQPILTICANGNTAVGVAQLLAKEGYTRVYNALGGMAGYRGDLVKPEFRPLDVTTIEGVDRELIGRVLEVLDRDVRPGLKRDGGDLQVLAVDAGVVKLKMVGACTGCGALKKTVNDGIRQLLMKLIPEITDVQDLTHQ